ncbi:MAG: hypothetical protein ACOX2X_02480 [Peptococcia bacterium]
MFSIIGVLGIGLLVVILIIAGVARSGSIKEGDEEEMIKNVYVYLVLFVTLMMTIGGSVAVFMAAADIVSPQPYYQSFEDYKYSREHGYNKPTVEGENDVKIDLSDEELQADYDRMVADAKAKEVNRAKNSLIKSLGWIVIPFPIFLYTKKYLVKKEA